MPPHDPSAESPDPLLLAYRLGECYETNYRLGPNLPPIDGAPFPEASPPGELFGMPVAGLLGISAGLLLNSRWIEAYARRGFHLLTYKTVRSRHRPCYPMPNWVFVDNYLPKQRETPVFTRKNLPERPEQASSAVCFGMPSMAPEIWRKDVARAKAAIGPRQILIVSVVASPEPGWSADDIAADYALCAGWAAEAGADAVELNLSCPNVCSAEGQVYLDPKLTSAVMAAARSAVGAGIPLLAKVGAFADAALMENCLTALAAHAEGVVLVDAVTRPIRRPDGTPAFGSAHLHAGVIGRAIHPLCVDTVRQAREISGRLQLELEILGVGGASTVDDIDDFFRAGASAVLLGSSPMYAPDLARTYGRRSQDRAESISDRAEPTTRSDFKPSPRPSSRDAGAGRT